MLYLSASLMEFRLAPSSLAHITAVSGPAIVNSKLEKEAWISLVSDQNNADVISNYISRNIPCNRQQRVTVIPGDRIFLFYIEDGKVDILKFDVNENDEEEKE